jgi:hypothetical protein
LQPQGKHFDVFAIPLFEQLKELLNPPYMESSVKTVIQVLKVGCRQCDSIPLFGFRERKISKKTALVVDNY